MDRAVICAASEMYALGVSTRKVGRALERMGAAALFKDRVGRICAELDAEVSALRERALPAQRYPYLWVDAAYVPCRRGGYGATAAVVTACGEDGVHRVVGFFCAVHLEHDVVDAAGTRAKRRAAGPRRARCSRRPTRRASGRPTGPHAWSY